MSIESQYGGGCNVKTRYSKIGELTNYSETQSQSIRGGYYFLLRPWANRKVRGHNLESSRKRPRQMVWRCEITSFNLKIWVSILSSTERVFKPWLFDGVKPESDEIVGRVVVLSVFETKIYHPRKRYLTISQYYLQQWKNVKQNEFLGRYLASVNHFEFRRRGFNDGI